MKTATIPMSKDSFAVEFLRKILLDQNNYLILISAFLMGSSNIAGGILPFGAAFFAAACGVTGIKLLTAVAVILGVATHSPLELVYVNAACMLLFNVLSIPLKNLNSKMNVKAAGLLFIAMLLPQLILTGLQGFLLYDILKAVFSSFIAFVLYFIFTFSVPIMAGITKRALLAGEEAISIAVTVALVLSGIGTLQYFGFSIRNILCVKI